MISQICFGSGAPSEVFSAGLVLAFALICLVGGIRCLWSLLPGRAPWAGMDRGLLIAAGLFGAGLGLPMTALTLYYLIVRPICGASP